MIEHGLGDLETDAGMQLLHRLDAWGKILRDEFPGDEKVGSDHDPPCTARYALGDSIFEAGLDVVEKTCAHDRGVTSPLHGLCESQDALLRTAEHTSMAEKEDRVHGRSLTRSPGGARRAAQPFPVSLVLTLRRRLT